MTARELEDKVWEQDDIRIVVRAAANTKVGDYPQQNAAQTNWSITKFLESRIQPLLGDNQVVVLMGDGEEPHGRTLLSSIRRSYESR